MLDVSVVKGVTRREVFGGEDEGFRKKKSLRG